MQRAMSTNVIVCALAPGRGWALLLATALLTSCGGGTRAAAQSGPAQPAVEHRATPDATATAAPGAQQAAVDNAPDDPDAPPPLAVSEADCQALLAHVVALANAAHRETVSPELAPTDDQLAAIRDRLAPEFLPTCLALDRAAFDCEMKARNQAELFACSSPPSP